MRSTMAEGGGEWRIRDAGNLFPRVGKTNNLNREKSVSRVDDRTSSFTPSILFYTVLVSVLKINIPFSTENERAVMVQEEEVKGAGGYK